DRGQAALAADALHRVFGHVQTENLPAALVHAVQERAAAAAEVEQPAARGGRGRGFVPRLAPAAQATPPGPGLGADALEVRGVVVGVELADVLFAGPGVG